AYDVDVYGGYVLRPGMVLGVDVDARGLSTTGVSANYPGGADNLYAVTASPFFSYTGRNIYTRVGVGFEPSGAKSWYKDLTETAFHITPQFEFRVKMSKAAGFWVLVNSGTKMNSLGMLRDYCIFMPRTPYPTDENAYMNVKAEGGLTFGPGAGLGCELYGGYASAKNWLTLNADGFIYENVKGWHAGIRLTYTGDMVNAYASGDFAPRTGDNFWVGNIDRADMNIAAGIDITPIPALTAGVSYRYVHGREAVYDLILSRQSGAGFYNLGIISDLGVHALYNVTPALSLRGELRNLLGRKYTLVYGVAAQQLNGLVGVTYKF
ncbi:MAG: hypothetical protein K2M19_03070, partial [Muribaculaceae bacterium]|nr:hypothetical protein [Muribaculaceae bacterium]